MTPEHFQRIVVFALSEFAHWGPRQAETLRAYLRGQIDHGKPSPTQHVALGRLANLIDPAGAPVFGEDDKTGGAFK